MARTNSLVNQMRALAKAHPAGYAALARKSGVDIAGCWRFANGEGGLSMRNLDRLAETLRLRVMVDSSVGGKI